MASEVVALISAAMNPDEGAWAAETLERHFRLRALGVDDGRRYFVLRPDGSLEGVTGLHRYEWGPRENVWLGWFAVAPARHGAGLGAVLLRETEEAARGLGYRKLFVETYGSATFARALRFYEKAGFRRVGRIEEYLPDGSPMIVLGKVL